MNHTAIFRADASATLGGGHVMRCMTLAHELARRGWRIDFAVNTGASKALSGIAMPQIGWNEGFDDTQADAEALQARFAEGCTLLVIDHYGWGAMQEAALAGFARLRLAFDDFADRRRDADIILDSNIGANVARHLPVSRTDALILAGPQFAQLREEFATWSARRLTDRVAEPEKVKRITLGFGLTDLGAMTARAAQVLLEARPQLEIDAIIGPAAPSRPMLEALARRYPVHAHIAPSSVAEIMARADMAIGASGQSAYERCCLGLPSLGLSIVDNQVFLVEELARAGATIHVPAMQTGWEAPMCAAFLALADDQARRCTMSEAARRICDGQGAIRVVNAIENRLGH